MAKAEAVLEISPNGPIIKVGNMKPPSPPNPPMHPPHKATLSFIIYGSHLNTAPFNKPIPDAIMINPTIYKALCALVADC